MARLKKAKYMDEWTVSQMEALADTFERNGIAVNDTEWGNRHAKLWRDRANKTRAYDRQTDMDALRIEHSFCG